MRTALDGGEPVLLHGPSPRRRVPRRAAQPALFDYARKAKDGRAQDALFEVRFGFELEDEWARNRRADDIDTIWDLLEALPPSNVEGNSRIEDLQLEKGEEGAWYGNDVIAIGEKELRERESFEDVLRHEVGHAVHEQRAAIIDPWLEQRFGWRKFDTSVAGIDGWVRLMGGWRGLPEDEQAHVRQLLRQALGGGESWVAGKAPDPPDGQPWWGKTFGPRLAYEKTGDDWYLNHAQWYRYRGRAFFLNYWYAQLMVVDAKTLDLVAKMPDAYAAMSHFEFFAELYALYYDVDDPKRKAIPPDVRRWLDQHVGRPGR